MSADSPKPEREEPLGFLAYLRILEREGQNRPRIGRNRTLREESVRLGQDPDLAFPTQDFSEVGTHKGKPSVRPQFMGFFGPFGALPLNTTEEVSRWFAGGDKSFVHFTDIFAARFQQLFFRAWSDTRRISQFDHPHDDRFQIYLGALAGIGTPAFRNRDSLPDVFRMPTVALFANRVRSPVRLRQILTTLLETEIEVEEHLPTWMAFEPDGLSLMGQRGSSLGRDMYLGEQVQSVGERIVLRIRVDTLETYRRFLPGGALHDWLADLVFWYLGKSFEVGVALSLPASEVAPARIGETMQLGYMAALDPAEPKDPDALVEVATFTLDPARPAAVAA